MVNNSLMPKKITGYVVAGIAVVAVLVLVYFFVTKLYSGTANNLTPTPQNSASGSTSETVNQKTGAITSNKISLTVTSPVNGDTLGSTNATVKGKTTSGADVFVNDQSGKADANGNFSISLGLDEGANIIDVSANDADGNATQQELNVTVISFQ